MKRNSEDSQPISKNTSEKVREYHVWELEEKAEKLLVTVFSSGLTIPVEIEDIAFHLGLEINPIFGLERAHDVLGTLWHDSGSKYWIVVDEFMMDHQETRYRFTVAEEIAHFVLHREHLDAVKDIAGAVRLQEKLKGNYRYVEANARRLAEGILMPQEPLRDDAALAFREVVRVIAFRNLDALRMQVTDILRRKYAVSTLAMQYRLQHYPLKTFEAMHKAFTANRTDLW